MRPVPAPSRCAEDEVADLTFAAASVLALGVGQGAQHGLRGSRQVNVVRLAILHPSARHGSDAQVRRDFRPAHGSTFLAPL